MADDPKTLWYQAWVKAWAAMPAIPKTKIAKIGDKFSYKYADLPDILDAVRPVLTDHGFAVSQSVEALGDETVGVATRVYHQAGWVESFGPTPMPAAGDPRAVGSAITYARRYAVSAALGIASDEDTDAEGTSPRRARTPREAPRTPQDAPKGHDKVEAAVRQAVTKRVATEHPTQTESWVETKVADYFPVAVRALEVEPSGQTMAAISDAVLDLIRAEKA